MILQKGGLVAFPTDTLYALGADAFNEKSILRVFEVKNRSLEMALPVLIADCDIMSDLATDLTQEIWDLSDKFWPGPLTIVVKKSPSVSNILTAGQDSIAIKQAAEQGSTEGSMDGIALAMGFDEANVGDANIKSQRAIKNAVGIGNTQAATKAAAEMATKSVQPNSSDMLLLMKKYNISPGTTNPAFVFPSPKKKGEEDFLFDEKFPVATPI